MKKIQLVIGPGELNLPVVAFACYICSLTRSPLTGIFLESVQRQSLKSIAESGCQGIGLNEEEEDIPEIDCKIKQFREACRKREVYPNVHRDRGYPMEEVLQESRYADMIIVDPVTTFEDKPERIPSDFTRQLMENAECPILVAPGYFSQLTSLLFLYDGSASAMQAIKSFACEFPELRSMPLTILQVKTKEKGLLTEKHQLLEWMKIHFDQVNISVVEGDSRTVLLDECIRRENTFVIMGAYGRKGLSGFFKDSHASLVIKTSNAPLFIYHK